MWPRATTEVGPRSLRNEGFSTPETHALLLLRPGAFKTRTLSRADMKKEREKEKKIYTKRKKKQNKTARYSSNERRFKLPHGQKFYLRMEQKANMPPN